MGKWEVLGIIAAILFTVRFSVWFLFERGQR